MPHDHSLGLLASENVHALMALDGLDEEVGLHARTESLERHDVPLAIFNFYFRFAIYLITARERPLRDYPPPPTDSKEWHGHC